jgi:hypothetical protein
MSGRLLRVRNDALGREGLKTRSPDRRRTQTPACAASWCRARSDPNSCATRARRRRAQAADGDARRLQRHRVLRVVKEHMKIRSNCCMISECCARR